MSTQTKTSEPNPFTDVTKMLDQFKVPGLDLAKIFEQFKIPGIDMAPIIESRKKDMQALVEANKGAYESMQALAQKQTQILSQAMQGIQASARELATGKPRMPDYAKQAEIARSAYQKALADMTALAEMTRNAQVDAMAVISQRANEGMQEMMKLMQKK